VNGSEPSIVPAGADDVPAIERLVAAAYEKYVARLGKPPAPMREDYRALVGARVVWIVKDGTQLAGLLVLRPRPDHALLDNVAVAPDRQGRGIGRRLLAFAEAEAQRLGLPEIRLYTHVAMTENLALYRRLGYEETGRARQDGYDRVFLSKRLTLV
jgi:ribosomal protein S18 acetylase RimI-like enzyme